MNCGYMHTTWKKNQCKSNKQNKRVIQNKQYDQQENWGFDNCHLLVECWLFLVDMCCALEHRKIPHTQKKESKWNKNRTISRKQWKIVAK